MEQILAMRPNMIHAPSAAGVKAPPKAQRPEDETRGGPVPSQRDEYVPEEKQEPSGLYRLGKDEGGQPKVFFDDPERPSDAPEKQAGLPDTDVPEEDKGADGPEKKAPGKKAERCTGNTDKVDREIERLKKKREELERQIGSETDEVKLKDLKRKLSQVESELRRKDNDAYRRQHTVFS